MTCSGKQPLQTNDRKNSTKKSGNGHHFHHMNFTESSQKISTHLLTMLIMRVILHIEQGGRDEKEILFRISVFPGSEK